MVMDLPWLSLQDLVECIGRDKVHKRFEFGIRVRLVTPTRANWFMVTEAYSGNLRNGRTLKSALRQVSEIFGFEPEMRFAILIVVVTTRKTSAMLES